MIRHFKWHKKRDESLQHGFMRYSPCDDCSDHFRNCSHNRKQTHYHCLKRGCEKVSKCVWFCCGIDTVETVFLKKECLTLSFIILFLLKTDS
jgi:hypothetical protein